jgi:hypothetical protein
MTRTTKHPAASSTPVRWRRWTEVTLSRQRSERVPTAVDFDRLPVWPWSHSDSTSRMDGPLDKLADHHRVSEQPRGQLGAAAWRRQPSPQRDDW